jgi:hypothetical protein
MLTSTEYSSQGGTSAELLWNECGVGAEPLPVRLRRRVRTARTEHSQQERSSGASAVGLAKGFCWGQSCGANSETKPLENNGRHLSRRNAGDRHGLGNHQCSAAGKWSTGFQRLISEKESNPIASAVLFAPELMAPDRIFRNDLYPCSGTVIEDEVPPAPPAPQNHRKHHNGFLSLASWQFRAARTSCWHPGWAVDLARSVAAANSRTLIVPRIPRMANPGLTANAFFRPRLTIRA